MQAIKPYGSVANRLWPTLRTARRSDRRLLDAIRQRARAIEGCAKSNLLQHADALRSRLQSEKSNLPSRAAVIESFALTAEALRRTTGKIYYDCQLLGGLVLSTGAIAEMQTGEGKTITCGLAATLYGFAGRGVHVATTNAYLAERDQEELAPILAQLGLTSSLITNDQTPAQKREAYLCDVTYGTGYEFGFDFLRDQLTLRNRPRLPLGTRFLGRLRGLEAEPFVLMQRPLAFAIIDEADSVLIDEAATPLILSGGEATSKPAVEVYEFAMQLADRLDSESEYEVDSVKRVVKLSQQGWSRVHRDLTPTIQQQLQRPWSQYIEQSLHAKWMLKRDVDYVVANDAVVIVDANTGRLHEERKWRSGLHQAIETREGVELTEEREIEARITRQRYFDFYEQVAGMTGTVAGNEAELMEFYRLAVVKIERNLPSGRETIRSRYFADQPSKFRAIVADSLERACAGQPVLIGTRTITQSRELAEAFSAEISRPAEQGVSEFTRSQSPTLLNGTQDQDEAAIISKAGQSGRITIATNMAGRGTDIKLAADARSAGGLHVIVAEHQDSPRVDRQLIGRAARQSDPGSCQFYVAADDEIIARHDPRLQKMLQRTADRETGECTMNFDRHIRALQERIERSAFLSRKRMVLQDRWMESVQEAVAEMV